MGEVAVADMPRQEDTPKFHQYANEVFVLDLRNLHLQGEWLESSPHSKKQGAVLNEW